MKIAAITASLAALTLTVACGQAQKTSHSNTKGAVVGGPTPIALSHYCGAKDQIVWGSFIAVSEDGVPDADKAQELNSFLAPFNLTLVEDKFIDFEDFALLVVRYTGDNLFRDDQLIVDGVTALEESFGLKAECESISVIAPHIRVSN